MKSLPRYLQFIVDPTFDDYDKNRGSARHAFLACVAIYHAIDRVSRRPASLRAQWGAKSLEFKLVDIIAHHFKHVQSDDEKGLSGRLGLPIGRALGFDAEGDTMDLRNIYYVIRDAVRFLHTEAAALESRK